MSLSNSTTSLPETDQIMQQSKEAFLTYKKVSDFKKAFFLEQIALEIEALGDEFIYTTMTETNLPEARLKGERGRTTMQLRMFASMLKEGSWVDASIDQANDEKVPAKPDLRKMLIPLGPVIVFGASNFPYAYSTAGGDTASALASGCSVVVKAHPAHLRTSIIVAEAIAKAVAKCNMPKYVFQHTESDSFELGKALVQHPLTAAVGFTGSFLGGKALYDYAAARISPIPVFSEMGSTNPVLLLHGALENNATSIAQQYATSITLGAGQFCTNPGILIGIASPSFNDFLNELRTSIQKIAPAKMLHEQIFNAFQTKSAKAINTEGVMALNSDFIYNEHAATPIIATVKADKFISDRNLQEEIFGPYAIVVICKDIHELKVAWQSVSGQLTTTLMGTNADFAANPELIDIATSIAGRVLFNGVPTGVEVCASMVHGGPFPATTDSRFTSVGINAVKRWVRPVCYQNCPDHLLPDALKNNNPLNIKRMVDGVGCK